MSQPHALPYQEPLFTAEQVSKAISVNRNTLLGWIKRYNEEQHAGKLSSVGLAKVTPGSTRLFSIEQAGLLAALRMAPEVVVGCLDEVREHARGLYGRLCAGIAWRSFANPDDRRPFLPEPESAYHIESRGFMGNIEMAHVTEHPYRYGGEDLKDLAGFPIPVRVLPLDATLRNAWTRAHWIAHGLQWED